MTTKDNRCVIMYTSHTSVSFMISGSVNFAKDEVFTSRFFKSSDTDDYTIHLTSEKGASLSFSSIQNIVYPTISTDRGRVLPNDALSVAKLQRIGIQENDQKIINPSIEIRLTPFLFYRVTGEVTAKIGKGTFVFEYFISIRITLRN